MTTQPDAAERAVQIILLSTDPPSSSWANIIRRETAADLDALRAERDAIQEHKHAGDMEIARQDSQIIDLQFQLDNLQRFCATVQAHRDIALQEMERIPQLIIERDAARADAERALDALADLYRYVRDHPRVFSDMLPSDHPYHKARVAIAALAAHRAQVSGQRWCENFHSMQSVHQAEQDEVCLYVCDVCAQVTP